MEIRLTDDLSTFPSRVGEWVVVDTRPEPARDRFPVIDDDLVDAYPSKGERRFTLIDDELSAPTEIAPANACGCTSDTTDRSGWEKSWQVMPAAHLAR